MNKDPKHKFQSFNIQASTAVSLVTRLWAEERKVENIDVQVGVGDGDMGALTQLDSDRARLSCGHKQAVRDIVQFIRKLFGGFF